MDISRAAMAALAAGCIVGGAAGAYFVSGAKPAVVPEVADAGAVSAESGSARTAAPVAAASSPSARCRALPELSFAFSLPASSWSFSSFARWSQ